MQTLASCLVASFTSSSVRAADEEFCTDYVLVAISQYWQSVDEGCGLTGLRWSADYKGQYNWCLTAHRWVAENETQARERMLKECRENKAGKRDTDMRAADPGAINESRVINEESNSKQLESTVTLGAGEEKDVTTTELNEKLLAAIAENNVERVKQLYDKGADLQFVTQNTELIKKFNMASRLGSGVTLQGDAPVSLQGNTVNGEPQAETPVSESLLSYAVSKGLLDVGLWLLEHDTSGLTKKRLQALKQDLLGNALIMAVKQKEKEKVQSLIEKGAPVDYELDMNFGTPLYFAVVDGNIELTKLLLEKGANPKYSTNAGENMLNFALGNVELLQLLLDYGADPDSNGESASAQSYPLIQAIKHGYSEDVELLLSKGANTEINDYDVAYPLLIAVQKGQEDSVKALLNHGANPNVIYNSVAPGKCADDLPNLVPLDEALKTGNEKIIQLLRQAGARTKNALCP